MPAVDLKNKRVLVMGLGRFGGGVGVSRWLVSQGAVVTVNDSVPADQLAASIQKLEGLPITFSLGGHPVKDFLEAELIVVNPAVNRDRSEPLQAAIKKGIPLTSEMNLFLERCVGKTIGITGSVGKSTTTALIHEALKAGRGRIRIHPVRSPPPPSPRVFLGGNIGRSLLMDLPQIRPQDLVVLELSSFMLESTPDIRWSPHIALITNIFPNHLDRHGGTMAGYTAAKQNILRFQTKGDIAIVNGDHELVSRWTHFAKGAAVKYTTRGPADRIPELQLPGEHNRSNAAAALAVLEALVMDGVELHREAAISAIRDFPGLTHRLQLVHAFATASGRRVRCFNDSKATSPDASITALKAFPARSAIFIVGGYDKHIDLSPFAASLADEAAAAVITIGETGPSLLSMIRAVNPGFNVEEAGTLASAVPLAKSWAETQDGVTAIVLSPACASWEPVPEL